MLDYSILIVKFVKIFEIANEVVYKTIFFIIISREYMKSMLQVFNIFLFFKCNFIMMSDKAKS